MNDRDGQSEVVQKLVSAIGQKLDAATDTAAIGDEKALATLYFDIGKVLVGADAGESEVEAVASALAPKSAPPFDLTIENLLNMALFYRTYGNHDVLKNLVDAISWPKHLEILERCDTDRAQEFYIRMTRKFEWSRDVLISKIEDFRPPQ